MILQETVDAFMLGQLLTDDLPLIASQAIQKGCGSPTLFELADSQGSDPEDVRKLFLRAARENGLVIPSVDLAALSAARRIANEVVDGRLAPYVGAKRIWDEIYTRFPEISQLRPFVGLASEFEDDESHRREYSQMIVDECMTLLADGYSK